MPDLAGTGSLVRRRPARRRARGRPRPHPELRSGAHPAGTVDDTRAAATARSPPWWPTASRSSRSTGSSRGLRRPGRPAEHSAGSPAIPARSLPDTVPGRAPRRARGPPRTDAARRPTRSRGRLPYPSLASPLDRLANRDFADLSAEELARLAAVMRTARASHPDPAVPPAPHRRTTAARIDLRAHPSPGPAHRRIPVRLRPLGRAPAPAAWSCSATSPDRWSPTPGRCCSCSTAPRRAGPRGGLHLRHPADPADAGPGAGRAGRALARAGQAAPDWSGGTRIGEALKAVHRPVTARAAWPAAPWCSSSPTAGRPATPAVLAHPDGAAVPARLPRSSGPTRAPHARATSRWSPAWPPPGPTATPSSAPTPSRPWTTSPPHCPRRATADDPAVLTSPKGRPRRAAPPAPGGGVSAPLLPARRSPAGQPASEPCRVTPRFMEFLNEQLTTELTAINQY